MGTNEHSVSKRTWPWRKDLPQVVQVALFAVGNGNSASVRGWHEKVNQCWLAYSRSWFDIAGDASAQPAALSDRPPYHCRLQQLDDENSELRSCVPCLRANIERLEEVRTCVCVSQGLCPPHSSGGRPSSTDTTA